MCFAWFVENAAVDIERSAFDWCDQRNLLFFPFDLAFSLGAVPDCFDRRSDVDGDPPVVFLEKDLQGCTVHKEAHLFEKKNDQNLKIISAERKVLFEVVLTVDIGEARISCVDC